MDNTQIVIKTLEASDKPMKAGEIAEAAGMDRKDVDKAMKILKQEGKIVSPKVCFWTTA